MDNWIWGLKNDKNGENLYMFEDLTRGRNQVNLMCLTHCPTLCKNCQLRLQKTPQRQSPRIGWKFASRSTKITRYHWRFSTWFSYGYGSIPMKIPFLLGWTSINPSYFDVNYRGTRFWLMIFISWSWNVMDWNLKNQSSLSEHPKQPRIGRGPNDAGHS